MLLIHEVARTTDYLTVYRDSDDGRLFYYIPQFAEVAARNDGTLNFGAALFKKNPNDPNDGFSLYNFGVRGVYPAAELARVHEELKQQYGSGVALQPVNPSVASPSLQPLTDGIYRSIKCQLNGGNLYTDLAASFTIDESLEPEFSQLVQAAVGWTGTISYKVRTKRTTFEWRITANWNRVQEHFKSQVSIKAWFVRANFSYEIQKLIDNETLKIETTGGTPEQKEKVFPIAEAIAARMFKPTIAPNPLPGHPSGGRVAISVNYSKTFEDKTATWSGTVSDFEEKDLGMAVYVREVPAKYFVGFPKLQDDLDGNGSEADPAGFMVDLDALDSHQMPGRVPKMLLPTEPAVVGRG